MRRLTLLLLSGCLNPSAPPPPPATAAELLVGTWKLAPPDASRLDAWKAALDGAAPPPGDATATWLARHPDHAQAARVRDALAAADAVRLDVTADAMVVRRPGRDDRVTWVADEEKRDARGHRELRLTTTNDRGLALPVVVRFLDADHLTLEPATPHEPTSFERVVPSVR